MFLNTNDRLINLKNVSNINIIDDSYKHKYRIIFNLNYNIEIPTCTGNKLISDYVYWDAVDENDFHYNIKYLKDNKYFQQNFLNHVNGRCFINTNEISTIKFSEKKYRVIFNLSHSITFTDSDKNERLTSEFVYVNCASYKEFKEYTKHVNTITNGLGE
jgi:DNA integrity scanning protein DisA with diadenylate cyclase activity